MAYSYATYTGDGATKTFAVPFAYLNKSYVAVYVDGVSVAFTWPTDSTINITGAAPAVDTIVRVARDTLLTSRLVDFADGSALSEADLDLSADQVFHVVQEAADIVADTLRKDTYDTLQWDAESKRIINLADPVNTQDAVTKAYMTDNMNSIYVLAVAAKDAALTAQALAELAETHAETAETNAAASAAAALVSEGNASTSAGNASTSATNALGHANTAAAEAAAAVISAANALSSANASSASAALASTYRSEASGYSVTASGFADAAAASAVNAAASAVAAAAAVGAAEGISDMGIGNVNHPLTRLPLKKNLTDGEFSGSLTFSRSGTATYVNRYGFVREVAADTPRFEKDGLLIEGPTTNILTDAQHMDNDSTSWARQQIDILKYYAESPDGNRGASKLVCHDTSSGYHNAQSPTIAWALGTTYTWSVFVKADEWDYLCLSVPGTFFGTGASSYFNISAGTIVSVGAGIDTCGIEPVGRGWYRVWITDTCTAAGSGRAQFWLTPDGSTISFNGVPGKGVQVWGAQLEALAFPTSFAPTTETFTSRASAATYWDVSGVLQSAAIDVERSSYNPGDLSAPPIQVLEDTSTNICLSSEDFTASAWVKDSTTIDSNVTAAPDGNTTADRINGVSTDRPRQIVGSLTAGVPYTVSMFVKADSSSWLRMRFNDTATWFDLSTGTIGTQYSEDAGIEDCGNGWYRCWIMDLPSTTVEAIEISPVGSNTSSAATGSMFMWGVQLEALPAHTSYIATTSSAVTRSADVWSSAAGLRYVEKLKLTFADNHPSIQPGNGYTYLADVKVKDGSKHSTTRSIIDGGQTKVEADRYSIFRFNPLLPARLAVYRSSGGVVYNDADPTNNTERVGLVITDTQYINLWRDGVKVSSSGGAVPLLSDKGGRVPEHIGIGAQANDTGQLYGHISNVRIYDRALNDFEMRIA